MRSNHHRSLLTVLGLLAGLLVVTATAPGSPTIAAAVDEKVATSLGGDYGMCATTVDGEMWCWGPDWDGFLANGTGGQSSNVSNTATTPVQATISDAQSTSGACALIRGGEVRCWGHDGIIEDGTGSFFSDPDWGTNEPTSMGFGAAAQVE
ncbi:MAG: hypothetical protein AAGG08_06495, partial [Actinomycetota bacterium]